MKLRKSRGRKTRNMHVQIKKRRRMENNIKIRREKSKSIFQVLSKDRKLNEK